MFRRLFLFLILVAILTAFPPDISAFYTPLSVTNNVYGIGIANLSDIKDVADLVNSTDGDWGYVTIVITQDQRDKGTWQNFFDEARRLHLIPILRIATRFDSENWEAPSLDEIDKWINFFNSLNWVVENRYVIIGNEPNHSKEWGGKVDPKAYGLYLKTFSEGLKNSSKDYFILPAALDSSAPNSKETMDEKLFIKRMKKEIPNIFDFIDGWNSHSYPNPDFSGSEKDTGRKSIRNYEWEQGFLRSLGVSKNYPIFITETGWSQKALSEKEVERRITYAFDKVWSKNKQVVAVTPFILNYRQEPFKNFSWKKDGSSFFDFYSSIQKLQKQKGSPKQYTTGSILFGFIEPVGFSGENSRGFILTRNLGQSIWDYTNLQVKQENAEALLISDIKVPTIEPSREGLLTFNVTYPKSGKYSTEIGIYANETKIGESFKAEIESFEPRKNKFENFIFRVVLTFKEINLIFRNALR